MPKEYYCRAYHLESYSAMNVIEAESQAEAMLKLKQLQEAGELVFDGFCEGEPVNELVVEPSEGDAGELIESFPENCLYSQRRINADLLSALEYCEQVLRDHEQYDDEEGSAESEAASMARAAIAKAREK
jgi:hypothetical protein